MGNKILHLLLIFICITSCNTNKKGEKISDKNSFMNIDEFLTYQHYNDSLACLESTSNKKIFLDIRFGDSKEMVTNKLFVAVENELIKYDTENWYLTHMYKDNTFKFVIDCSYHNDSLYEMFFEGELLIPAKISDYDIKMALFDYFKTDLKDAAKLKHDGSDYRNMLKYEGSIKYSLDNATFYIVDMPLEKKMIDNLDISESQAIADFVFGSE
ncbi:hypothetical protein [Bacteroides helcogenes]|nr:hypothetical protein [Bacteroides helcogenes]